MVGSRNAAFSRSVSCNVVSFHHPAPITGPYRLTTSSRKLDPVVEFSQGQCHADRFDPQGSTKTVDLAEAPGTIVLPFEEFDMRAALEMRRCA